MRLVFSSAVFEESSGIHKTLAQGPTTQHELGRHFALMGLGEQYYDSFRRQLARLAAVELFAWAKNHLGLNGHIVCDNSLSPKVVPTPPQLEFLGFELVTELFREQRGEFTASVSVYRSVERAATQEMLGESCLVVDSGHLRKRTRIWRWIGEAISGTWLSPDSSIGDNLNSAPVLTS